MLIARENSEVLPLASVAVAVITLVGAIEVVVVTWKLALPVASVLTETDPRYN